IGQKGIGAVLVAVGCRFSTQLCGWLTSRHNRTETNCPCCLAGLKSIVLIVMRLQYLLFIAFVLGLAGRGTAQEVTDVLNWGGEITWHKHLIQQMHEQYHERDEEIQQAFKSKTMGQDYLQKVRQNYTSIQGSFPPQSPLNARETGTIQRDGYHIEKVVYESFSNHHV